ncbi:MAG: Na+/H+ antiporter subunit D [Bacteroidetes bacterium]|nr:Na+/H+ antiporter subunit D [Bacteroidota bacterium]MBU1579966.1 Na+/H+ antiporter subunit D [Bacteroidota bacterium]MBU2464810.1 Na+/H+ antiporter subunit D [Bacteroidota bacterium]MBU2558017.1 Na+/H+ antiporter subunit D [Bacteroidota bacterium]
MAYQHILSVLSVVAQLIVALSIFNKLGESTILVAQAGGWPAPFGISFLADYTATILLIAVALLALPIVIYSIGFIDKVRQQGGLFVLYQGLILGVNGAFLTADIFNLYVWFEVMLISSFVLITLGAAKQQLRGSVKYLVMNLLGSSLFVAAIGLTYSQLGTLNMADIADKIMKQGSTPLLNSAIMLFFIAFGIKAAVFPFFFWLPASYPTPPIAITAFFGATLTKVGVYVMLRFYSLFANMDEAFWQPIIFIVAGLTMLFGVLMAASSYDIRKILSFHIISQIGYMLMGIGLFSLIGLAGALFFIVHNMFSKTAAFMAAGLIKRFKGSYDLNMLGGLYKSKPILAFLFLIPALSLAGIPPTSGFFGKLFLVMGGFQSGEWLITIVAIVVSILTLFSMIKIWNEAVWKPAEEKAVEPSNQKLNPLIIAASFAMTVFTLFLGLTVFWTFDSFTEAAAQLLNPQLYIDAVLNNNRPALN